MNPTIILPDYKEVAAPPLYGPTNPGLRGWRAWLAFEGLRYASAAPQVCWSRRFAVQALDAIQNYNNVWHPASSIT